MIKKHGGSSGVRDKGMFESAIHRPFATFAGEDLYFDIYLKAAALIQSIVKNHPFIDGNKRTAYASAFVFLKKNGIEIIVPKAIGFKFMLDVANKNLSVDEIALWLKKYSKKI
jgi:death-on-curing protein